MVPGEARPSPEQPPAGAHNTFYTTWQRTADQRNVNMEHSTTRDPDIDCNGQLHEIDGVKLHWDTHILHIIIFHLINILLWCR